MWYLNAMRSDLRQTPRVDPWPNKRMPKTDIKVEIDAYWRSIKISTVTFPYTGKKDRCVSCVGKTVLGDFPSVSTWDRWQIYPILSIRFRNPLQIFKLRERTRSSSTSFSGSQGKENETTTPILKMVIINERKLSITTAISLLSTITFFLYYSINFETFTITYCNTQAVQQPTNQTPSRYLIPQVHEQSEGTR